MRHENGEWMLHGTEASDPSRIRDPEGLIAYVEQAGFLPLFQNEIPGFSVEEHTLAADWWAGDPERDPWEWRSIAARSRRVAYGKFFSGKAGFLSLEWLPLFVNHRRDGYDFDSLYEAGKAGHREHQIMELFTEGASLFSWQIRQLLDTGKSQEGALTRLQMQLYLVTEDFQQRLSKQGVPYGMSAARYCTPEKLWGYEAVTAAYGESPADSYDRIRQQILKRYPDASDRAIRRICP